jgi:hypothetical protein
MSGVCSVQTEEAMQIKVRNVDVKLQSTLAKEEEEEDNVEILNTSRPL